MACRSAAAFMNKKSSICVRLTLVGCLNLAAAAGFGQAPVIEQLGQNGELVCTNLQPSTTASVVWALSAEGPWTNIWPGLDALPVDANGAIQTSLPIPQANTSMFYRVLGVAKQTRPAPDSMALIPAGKFTMGDAVDSTSVYLPLHTNQISAFYIDRSEVTKALWDEVYQWATNNGYSFDNGGAGKAADHPVQMVSWYDCVKWCNARSEREGRAPAYYSDGSKTTVYRSGAVNLQNDWVNWYSGYRLPTEAEWEKSARGGAEKRRFPWSNTNKIGHSQANYNNTTFTYFYDIGPTRGYDPVFSTNGEPYTSSVGYFAANDYGLYDMAGNVWEWVWDWSGSYSSDPQFDPRGPDSGSYRLRRGGSWAGSAALCRTASRDGQGPALTSYSMGFRSVLPTGEATESGRGSVTPTP